ncbi:MAG: ATP-dependent DNA helicase RecQ [Synechococcales bacterium]|nr:ATP-dependent DNA helicase RecQ [Synechococcales bacterium]
MNQLQLSEWERVRATFQRIWGYPDFRPPQGEIVHCLISGQDALIVMPTGGGKSICFQLPALMQTGLTLVVSPLVALMENQVAELREKKLPAASLHGELPPQQKRQTLWQLEHQRLRLLYLSPETLLSPAVWERLCQPTLKINALILDEAHCLVQWGDTFRPAYRRLGTVRPALLKAKGGGNMAIAAFTATADPDAQTTIRTVLQLQDPQPFLLNPYRPNLHLAVQTVYTRRGRRQQMLKFMRARSHQAGLVYVRTRRDSEELADWLSQQGFTTAAYHAGLGASERRRIEAAWLGGKILWVICTNAFGMGINHPHVRAVIHYHSPLILPEYVQEVGRGGRDGDPAEALTLISEPTGWLDPDDQQRQSFFLNKLRSQQQRALQLAKRLPNEGNVTDISRQMKDGAIALSLLHSMGRLRWTDPFHYRLESGAKASLLQHSDAAQQMVRYLRTKDCRWKFLLDAFGFSKDAAGMQCGHCDRCQANRSG